MIFQEKKRAATTGDRSVVEKMTAGGNDVISILRKSLAINSFGMLSWCLTGSDMPGVVRENLLAPEGDRLSDEEMLAQMRCVSSVSILFIGT